MDNARSTERAASYRSHAASPFRVKLPGSKSYTNRALVIAAQRVGRTSLTNALHADDTLLLAQALDQFGGLSVQRTASGFQVVRTAPRLSAPVNPLHIGGAGTPARLLMAFAAAADGATIISGNRRLCERPMTDLIVSLRAAGFAVEELVTPGCLPVRVHGGQAANRSWSVSGSVSSQFLTALLIHAAQQQGEPVTINVQGHLVSKPYVRMTLQMMRDCGIKVGAEKLSRFVVNPGSPAGAEIAIEPDASAMSYFLAAAALTRSAVTVEGIGLDSMQGDINFARVLRDMGCHLAGDGQEISLSGGPLAGVAVDMEDMPDTVLTLAVVAAFATGRTHISNIANLRLKESDRIHAAAENLQRLGVLVSQGDDFLEIKPRGAIRPAQIATYDDHRVAMAFSLAGLRQDGIELEDPECVRKSFPSFWEELARFRAHRNAMGVAS
jgi:3-phosphoshikimate 1-carboxyvinyltransferase